MTRQTGSKEQEKEEGLLLHSEVSQRPHSAGPPRLPAAGCLLPAACCIMCLPGFFHTDLVECQVSMVPPGKGHRSVPRSIPETIGGQADLVERAELNSICSRNAVLVLLSQQSKPGSVPSHWNHGENHRVQYNCSTGTMGLN